MKRIVKYKKYIILTLILAVLLILSINIKNIITPKYKDIPEVKLKEIKKDKSLAIMISEDRNKYEEYDKETWPGIEYIYKEAKCIDNSGELVEDAISFERETNTVTLETEKTIYCTLYFDYKGTGEEDKPYRIQYIEDLVDLQVSVNNGETYEGKHFELGRDLDFQKNDSYQNYQTKEYGDINGNSQDEELKTELITEKGWKPIGDYLKPFSGILDGKEHKIVSLYINNNVTKDDQYPDSYSGLFGALNNATIKNLTISGEIEINARTQVGGFVGNMSNNSLMENCHNEVNILNTGTAQEYSGGLVGCAESVTIKNSSNKGSIEGPYMVGGIIGDIANDNAHEVTIDNTFNEGIISGKNDVGGLVGNNGAKSTLLITNSHNDGTIMCTSGDDGFRNVGGLVGVTNGDSSIEKSYNIGNVTANGTNSVRIGGLIGAIYKKVIINNSYNANNTLKISPNGYDFIARIGGLIGLLYNQNEISIITNSYNSGEIVNGNRVGGLIGELSSGIIIDKCYNSGNIDVTNEIYISMSQIGGLIGAADSYSFFHPADIIMNSYNTGNITANNKNVTYIVGLMQNLHSNKLILLNSYNSGNLDLQSNIGTSVVSGLVLSNFKGLENQSSEKNVNILNSVYNIGTVNGIITYKYGLGYFDVTTTTNDIKNTYYENSVSASNVTGIGGTPMSLNDMKLESFVTQLNTNKNTIDLSSIDSSLSEYTLCNWKLGNSGYPELAC